MKIFIVKLQKYFVLKPVRYFRLTMSDHDSVKMSPQGASNPEEQPNDKDAEATDGQPNGLPKRLGKTYNI